LPQLRKRLSQCGGAWQNETYHICPSRSLMLDSASPTRSPDRDMTSGQTSLSDAARLSVAPMMDRADKA